VDGSVLRAAAFLAGLLGFRAAEVLGPHHPPTVPLRRRWVANIGLGLVNGILVSALCVFCLSLAGAGRLPWALAPLPRLVPSAWMQVVAAIVILDLVTYALHRAFHRVPFLWRFHEVHHTDLDLDVSSASRFHTGEVIFSSAVKLGVVAVLGIPPAGLVAFEIALLAAAQFEHANVRISPRLETILWRTIVPPAMHRIHHAPNRGDADSNYGTILTLWDRLFRSFNRRTPDPAPAFGIPAMRNPDALGAGTLALLPFRRPPA
jgi:sterol desaturase/sphingolipid hydroxylase (fatty acid hydroxylase superfamily)